ncbi:zinc-binding dehydrogenase [Streptomyces sp. NPDC051776]|uniref:zinc-dependent alcohol dehydrogenase n=1 Tax=Streptomyces sp. NPDC051776 TaxID=3155414 RepID=UPI003433DD39
MTHSETSGAAVWTGPHRLEWQQLPLEAPPAGGLLLELAANGICGSDVHFVGMTPARPLVLGHEIVGRITAGGPGFAGCDAAGTKVGVGDTVALFPWVPCGRCWGCRRFGPAATTCSQAFVYGIPPEAIGAAPGDTGGPAEVRLTGGFGHHVLVRDGTWFWRVPDALPPAVASLLDPLAVAVRSVDVTRTPSGAWDEVLTADSTAFVLGLGTVGLLTALVLRRSGVGTVVVSGSRPRRLAAGERVGADLVLDRNEFDLDQRRRRILDLTGGRGADLVVDATNSPLSLAEAIGAVRRLGTVVEVGNVVSSGTVIPVDPARDICQASIRLLGVTYNPPRSYAEAIALLSDRTLRFEELITGIYPIREAGAALDALSGDVVKLVLSGK